MLLTVAFFSASHRTPLPVGEAWARLTDWRRHARHVPLTTITVSGPNAVGTVFTARTGLGPLAFDDPMEIVEWEPPGEFGQCRLLKTGRVVLGWAQLRVDAAGGGALATWEENISLIRLPRLAAPVTAVSSRLLFTRVLRRLLD